MAFWRREDVLADLVVDEVPASVRATMSEHQIKAVRAATKRRHALDLRFTLPLGFARAYFVLLVGKDERREAAWIRDERRNRAGFYLSSLAIAVLAVLVVIVGAVTLYLLKSRAGVDLFPGHLRDYLPFTR